MGQAHNGAGDGNASPEAVMAGLAEGIRQAAFTSWASQREEGEDRSSSLFDRIYLGHYSHIDHYIETLVDSYELDRKLDAAIAPPFRDFVDIDVPALARFLVDRGSVYCIPAVPVGVWVFNGDIE